MAPLTNLCGYYLFSYIFNKLVHRALKIHNLQCFKAAKCILPEYFNTIGLGPEYLDTLGPGGQFLGPGRSLHGPVRQSVIQLSNNNKMALGPPAYQPIPCLFTETGRTLNPRTCALSLRLGAAQVTAA